MRMNRAVAGVAAIGTLALVLAGCGKTRPVHYYRITPPAPPNAASDPYPLTLLVGHFAAPMILHDAPIVYQVGANEVGTYQYHRWISPPPLLVENQLMELLRYSGRYRSVGAVGSEGRGDYIVRGRVDDFEEIDTASGIVGRVNLDLELYERKTGHIVWSKRFAHDEPASTTDVGGVVTALDRGLRLELAEAAADLDRYFGANLPK